MIGIDSNEARVEKPSRGFSVKNAPVLNRIGDVNSIEIPSELDSSDVNKKQIDILTINDGNIDSLKVVEIDSNPDKSLKVQGQRHLDSPKLIRRLILDDDVTAKSNAKSELELMFDKLRNKNKLESKANDLSPKTSGMIISKSMNISKLAKGTNIDKNLSKSVSKNLNVSKSMSKNDLKTRMKSSPARKLKKNHCESPKVTSVKALILKMEGAKNGAVSKFQAEDKVNNMRIKASPTPEIVSGMNNCRNSIGIDALKSMEPEAECTGIGKKKLHDSINMVPAQKNSRQIALKWPNFDAKMGSKSAQSVVSTVQTSLRKVQCVENKLYSRSHSPKVGRYKSDAALRLDVENEAYLDETLEKTLKNDECQLHTDVHGQRNCSKPKFTQHYKKNSSP